MLPRCLTAFVLVASLAHADVIPPDVSACDGLSAGAACTTFFGDAGTCVEETVSRPDYSAGVPPKYRQVKMLRCQAAGASSRKASAAFGLGLALLAAALAWGTRRRPTATA